MRRRLSLILILILVATAGASAQESKENADFKLAVGLYNDGMYDLAIQQFQRFIDAYPGGSQGVEARFYLGLSQLRAGHTDEARATFQNFALAYPDHPKAGEAWFKTGEAFEQSGNFSEAASAYERVRVFHPRDPLVPEALYKAGIMYRRSGNRTAAGNCFKTITREFPASPQATRARLTAGMIDAEDGNFALAEKEIRRAIEGASGADERSEGTLVLGRLQASEGLFNAAESTFSSLAQSKTPSLNRSLARVELGLLPSLRGKTSRATTLLRPCVTDTLLADSLRFRAALALGDAHLAEGNYADARAQYQRVLADTANPAIVRNARIGAARAYLGEGKGREALAVLQPLTGPRDQSDAVSASLSARAATMLGRFTEAATSYNSIIDHSTSQGAVLEATDRLSSLYMEHLQNDQQAIALANRIAELFPNSPAAPRALQRIALIAEMRHDDASALQTYREILKRYPACDSADRIRDYTEALLDHGSGARDSSIRSLAAVIASLLSGGEKSAAYFSLGMIYFRDLNDYAAAVKCFEQCMNDPGPAGAAAEYYRARALRRQAETSPSLAPEAIGAFTQFLAHHPSSPFTEPAIKEKYRLERAVAGQHGLASLAGQYLRDYPESALRAELWYDFATGALTEKDTISALPALRRVASDSASTPLRTSALVLLGEILAHRGIVDSAYLCWQRASTAAPAAPSNAQALWDIGELETRRHHAAEAAIEWKRLVDEYGYTSYGERAEDRLAESYVAAGNYREAAEIYSRRLADEEANPFLDRPDYSLLFHRAQAYDLQGMTGRASADYRRYLIEQSDGPYAATAYLALGTIAKTQGNPSLATAYFHEARESGASVTPTREIADLFFQNEQYQQAASAYLVLLPSADSLSARQYLTAQAIIATYRQDNETEGDRLAAQYRDLFDHAQFYQAQIAYEQGLCLFRKQQYPRARSVFEHVRGDYGKTRFGPWSRFYIAKIAELSNKPEDAASAYDDLLKDEPASDVVPRVLLSLGNMHFNAERYEQAIAYYQKILADSARAGDVLRYALNNLIDAYTSMKVYDAALTTARRFIRLFPTDESIPDKNITIGTLYTKMGYYDQAIQQFQTILSEGGETDAELMYDIGEAYYYKGDYQQAILEFLKVPYLTARQSKNNWVATSLYMAGQSYEKLSKLQEAVSMYQQVIDRPGIDATFKAAARKEIARVQSLMGNQ